MNLTPEQQTEANARIAESLGHKFECPCGECITDYFSPTLPVATRLEMWEALTEEEQKELCHLILNKGEWLPVDSVRAAIHFALSPEFVEAWCRIRGIL